MSDQKVNDRPTGFPMADYEHWLLEHANECPWTESGGRAIIRDLVDLADRAVDSAAEITRLRTELAEVRADLAEESAVRAVAVEKAKEWANQLSDMILERDTLRQQLAAAREGLSEIRTGVPDGMSVYEYVCFVMDTLAKLDQMGGTNA